MRALLATLLTVLVLAGCGGEEAGGAADDMPSAAADERVEVVEGEPFGFDGFTVTEGWSLVEREQLVDVETAVLVGAEGEATNDGEEAGSAVFELVLVDGDQAVATVRCTSEEIAPGASHPLTCLPTQPMPEAYDRVVVRKITR